jgi:hypothetical protein
MQPHQSVMLFILEFHVSFLAGYYLHHSELYVAISIGMLVVGMIVAVDAGRRKRAVSLRASMRSKRVDGSDSTAARG